MLDSDDDLGGVVNERDTHRPDRRARDPRDVERTSNAQGVQSQVPRPRGEELKQVLQVVETPRLNVKEFHLERVHPTSESKCQGRPVGNKQCATPVLPGTLQPGYQGVYVYYEKDKDTGLKAKVGLNGKEIL